MSAWAAVALPPEVRHDLLGRVQLISAGHDLPKALRPHGWSRRRDGFPPPMYVSPRRRLIAAAVAAVIVVGGGSLGAALTLDRGDDSEVGVRAHEATTTSRGPATAVPPTPGPGGSTATSKPSPRSSGSPGTAAPDTTPPAISGVVVSPGSFYDQANSCSPTTTTVSASASDPSGISSVVMLWSSSAGSGSKGMGGAGGYSATLGPFALAPSAFTTISVTVRATDAAGNVAQASTSAELQHCLF